MCVSLIGNPAVVHRYSWRELTNVTVAYAGWGWGTNFQNIKKITFTYSVHFWILELKRDIRLVFFKSLTIFWPKKNNTWLNKFVECVTVKESSTQYTKDANAPTFKCFKTTFLNRYHVNRHPVAETHVAPLAINYELFRNRSWGWSSKTASVLSLACRGFETGCNGFLLSRLLWSQRFLRSSFIIAIETTFTIIYCIGNYYHYIDTS